MAHTDEFVSLVLAAAGIPDSLILRIVADGPVKSARVIASLDLADPFENDAYGLLSAQSNSETRRRRLTSALPLVADSISAGPLLQWLDNLSQSRYRPLRSAATLASYSAVERLLSKPVGSGWDSLEFCKKLASHILIRRCRDTCPVIRQMSAEYIGRWWADSTVVLAKKEELFGTICHLVIDDKPKVRIEMLKSVLVLSANHKVPIDCCRLLANAFVARCEEVHESEMQGSLCSEIILHADCLKKITDNSNCIDFLDKLVQILWDRHVPLQARQRIADIVSKQILAKDILDSKISDPVKDFEMLSAFIHEYCPWRERKQPVNHLGVLESFVCGRDLDEKKLSLMMQSAVLNRDLDLIEAISMEIENTGNQSFTFPDPKLIFSLIQDVRVLKTVLRLSKTPCFLGIIPEEVIDSISTIVSPESTSSYSSIYLAYRLWHSLSLSSPAIAEALNEWQILIFSQVSVEKLQTMHALESAISRPVVDLGTARALLQFIRSGNAPSVSALVCAIDLAIIQFLKSGTAQELRSELDSTLRTILKQTESASPLAAFCIYRLRTIERTTSTEGRKNKQVLEFEDPDFLIGSTASTYIVTSLIERGKLATAVISYME